MEHVSSGGHSGEGASGGGHPIQIFQGLEKCDKIHLQWFIGSNNEQRASQFIFVRLLFLKFLCAGIKRQKDRAAIPSGVQV